MLRILMLSVLMLSILMLSVLMLTIIVPLVCMRSVAVLCQMLNKVNLSGDINMPLVPQCH
jgi:hypothetical protein